MDLMNVLVQALPVLASAGAVYAAIKADLAAMHERATIALASADKAHARIDNLLQGTKK
jgi:hypothetical protein